MTAKTTGRAFDVLTMGRSLIDLYAHETGVPFPEIKSFSAYVGGCPTNIAVGARRLGLRTALLTAVGQDPVGDFVLGFLAREGVAIDFAVRKPGRRTSAVLLGIEPPDRFTVVHYRDNCADLELDDADVRAAPVTATRALLITGTGLCREPSRGATLLAAGLAREHEARVVLDLDYRADHWADVLAYSEAVREASSLCDVVIGTSDEVAAAAAPSDELAPLAAGGLEERAGRGAAALLAAGPRALVVKRGAQSTLIFTSDGEACEVATFPVEVYNVLGAGDAFASGFLYGYLRGWDWSRAARMGNACGAIVVTRHGCANFMPHEQEALTFIEERGGF